MSKKNLFIYFLTFICDGSYLHSHHHVAVAQNRHVFIYDQDLVEIHRLSALIEPAFLEFLPYHWLLVSAVRIYSLSAAKCHK